MIIDCLEIVLRELIFFFLNIDRKALCYLAREDCCGTKIIIAPSSKEKFLFLGGVNVVDELRENVRGPCNQLKSVSFS